MRRYQALSAPWVVDRDDAVVKPYRGPPMTLGVAAAAVVRLIVW